MYMLKVNFTKKNTNVQNIKEGIKIGEKEKTGCARTHTRGMVPGAAKWAEVAAVMDVKQSSIGTKPPRFIKKADLVTPKFVERT